MSDEKEKWIEIKYGPFGEQPIYYWFEPVEKEEEKHLMEMIGDWFGPPQIRNSEQMQTSDDTAEMEE